MTVDKKKERIKKVMYSISIICLVMGLVVGGTVTCFITKKSSRCDIGENQKKPTGIRKRK